MHICFSQWDAWCRISHPKNLGEWSGTPRSLRFVRLYWSGAQNYALLYYFTSKIAFIFVHLTGLGLRVWYQSTRSGKFRIILLWFLAGEEIVGDFICIFAQIVKPVIWNFENKKKSSVGCEYLTARLGR